MRQDNCSLLMISAGFIRDTYRIHS